MEFIKAEEFLKQSLDVQVAFVDWWRPSIGDLFCDVDAFGVKHIGCVLETDKIEIIDIDKKHGYYIPLLTEGQLRKFIEDKTNRIVFLDFEITNGKVDYDIYLFDSSDRRTIYEHLGDNLLKAYWKVALEIAKEEIKNE